MPARLWSAGQSTSTPSTVSPIENSSAAAVFFRRVPPRAAVAPSPEAVSVAARARKTETPGACDSEPARAITSGANRTIMIASVMRSPSGIKPRPIVFLANAHGSKRSVGRRPPKPGAMITAVGSAVVTDRRRFAESEKNSRRTCGKPPLPGIAPTDRRGRPGSAARATSVMIRVGEKNGKTSAKHQSISPSTDLDKGAR